MSTNSKQQPEGRSAALDLIKQRIKELYGDEPDSQTRQPSLVERFWQDHADHPSPESAWHQFYAGLTNDEKQTLWNEYHAVSSGAGTVTQPHSSRAASTQAPSQPVGMSNDPSHGKNLDPPKLQTVSKAAKTDSIKDTKQKLIKNLKAKSSSQSKSKKPRSKLHHWKPLFFSVIAMLIILLAQYNTLVVAFAKQYISPGNTLQSPVIIDPSVNIEVGPEPRIIIPKINVDVPVVFELGTVNEEAIQNALEDGVVHYHGTSLPGQAGNNVIVGHSSNNFLNAGKYKFAFVLLDRLEVNDTYIIHYNSVRYVYKVVSKNVIEPTDFSLIQPTAVPTSTLITCTPPGTSWKRLVIQAEQISPTPTTAQTDPANLPAPQQPLGEDAIVPGNSPSLWQRFTDWIF